MSDSPVVRVVSVAFRKVVPTGGIQYTFRKIGEPVLEIEVLGDLHNFEKVGELLFEHFLEEIRGEELYEHLWRFEPSEAQDCLALNPKIPILSKDMHASDPFRAMMATSGSSSTPYIVKEGSDLLFKYDEGSPTYLMTTIESIAPMPEGKTIENYPAKKEDPKANLVEKKRKRLAEIPVRTITMDEAYPSLRHRLLSERNVRLEIGRGSDAAAGKHSEPAWARIWGGDPKAAYCMSLESFHAFDDLNEAFLCFDRAIQKQASKDFPTMNRVKEYRSRETGEVYRKQEKNPYKLGVVANVLPASVPAEQYKNEMMLDLPGFECGRVGGPAEDPVLRSWSRSCFNFALQRDWRKPQKEAQEGKKVKNEEEQQQAPQQEQEQRAAPPNFSFTQQFPQCTAWLTYPCTTSHWLFLEHGVLHAVKGKHNPKTGENVVHRTLTHASLHALFTDLEDQLVLPKAWKIKKNS